MGTTTLLPVGEYLSRRYRPDREYVDGQLVERNVGEYDHARLQGLVFAYLLRNERKWSIRAVPECRVQVKPARYRIPDVCALRTDSPIEQIVETPPLLCIEILSPEDRLSEMQGRIDDYLAMGVPYVWTIDPRMRRAWVTTKDGAHEAKDGVLRAGEIIQVPLAELFD
ncbi:MAG: Uma2 family endonuclease [Acidobacteria bacterium]|nr:Uma2 family endonuclease [Acidobacteriota bacterium]